MDRIAPWLQSHWDERAAGNFIGGGTGSGLAIVAAVLAMLEVGRAWWTFAAAALFICAGLGLVWLEIGRPWRFLHVFFHPQTSWMTREALIAPALFAALGAAAWRGGSLPSAAVLVLALAFLFSQAHILRASMGIPAWREPRIVPLILATGLAEGAGGFLILATVADRAAPSSLTIWLSGVLLLLRWLAWTSYWQRFVQSPAPVGTHRVLDAIQVPFLAIGALAPLLLLAAGQAWPNAEIALAPVAGLLSVAGGWLLKYTIVVRAAFNQGFAVPFLPLQVGGTGASRAAAPPGWS
jgi:phenylacetyl-CoA:acceptor oxidoreductase subunit 2